MKYSEHLIKKAIDSKISYIATIKNDIERLENSLREQNKYLENEHNELNDLNVALGILEKT